MTFGLDETLVLTQGLEALALMADDSDIDSQFDGLKSLVKWVIKGQGKPQYNNQETQSNTLLPDGNNNYCMECMTYFIDQIIETGGSGYSGGYNWIGYATYGIYNSLADGLEAEQLQCSVHNDCWAYEVDNITKDGYGETCVEVLFNDGKIVTGLYCEIYH